MGEDARITRSKAAVVAAAVELVVERGVAATTVDAIAERSGVAKTTIYRHWPGKSEVIFDAIGTLVQFPSMPDTGSLREDLCAMTEGLAAMLSRPPWTSLMPSLLDAAARDKEFARLHRASASGRHEIVRDVILRGIDSGELPPGVDADEVIDLLAGPVFYRRLVSDAPIDASFVRRLVDRVLTAFAPPS